jgi:hypothetical protein
LHHVAHILTVVSRQQGATRDGRLRVMATAQAFHLSTRFRSPQGLRQNPRLPPPRHRLPAATRGDNVPRTRDRHTVANLGNERPSSSFGCIHHRPVRRGATRQARTWRASRTNNVGGGRSEFHAVGHDRTAPPSATTAVKRAASLRRGVRPRPGNARLDRQLWFDTDIFSSEEQERVAQLKIELNTVAAPTRSCLSLRNSRHHHRRL